MVEKVTRMEIKSVQDFWLAYRPPTPVAAALGLIGHLCSLVVHGIITVREALGIMGTICQENEDLALMSTVRDELARFFVPQIKRELETNKLIQRSPDHFSFTDALRLVRLYAANLSLCDPLSPLNKVIHEFFRECVEAGGILRDETCDVIIQTNFLDLLPIAYLPDLYLILTKDQPLQFPCLPPKLTWTGWKKWPDVPVGNPPLSAETVGQLKKLLARNRNPIREDENRITRACASISPYSYPRPRQARLQLAARTATALVQTFERTRMFHKM